MSSQRKISSFFGGGAQKKRRVNHSQPKTSSFGECPLCRGNFPSHSLERHAAVCDGPKVLSTRPRTSFGECPVCQATFPLHSLERHAAVCDGSKAVSGSFSRSDKKRQQHLSPNDEPIPGLFLFYDFVSEEEEQRILSELDGESQQESFLPWKPSSFNGRHFGKRWGVHCDLRAKLVEAAENPLPHFMDDIVIPRLATIQKMAGCVPNEANAIDYRRKSGHFLTAHVDDRQLSKEPIANLSLAGDCYMTFRNVSPKRNTAPSLVRVFLPHRCLQVLTGTARYDFSHAIDSSDIISPRRVSVTMRESPLTIRTQQRLQQSTEQIRASRPSATTEADWWRRNKPQNSALKHQQDDATPPHTPSDEPIPGLLIFENFISQEEERLILNDLDHEIDQPWLIERHSGIHCEKRFGVDHDLWNSKQTREPKHPLPTFVTRLLAPRLARIRALQGLNPNEVNCISYCKNQGHSLASHVNDRHKHKEPIANLSLAGECIMTYRNVAQSRNLLASEKRVLLRPRCLQVITGKARYEYAHGIKNEDIRSSRRVSVTLRCTLR